MDKTLHLFYGPVYDICYMWEGLLMPMLFQWLVPLGLTLLVLVSLDLALDLAPLDLALLGSVCIDMVRDYVEKIGLQYDV